MTLKTRFKKQVFIRLSDDQTGLVCIAKWWFLSRVTRISFRGTGPYYATQATKDAALEGQAVSIPVRRAALPGERMDEDGENACPSNRS